MLYLWDLEEQRGGERGGFQFIIFGVGEGGRGEAINVGGGSNFMGRVDPFRHHDRVNNQLINSKYICENEFRYEEVAVMK